LVVLQSSQGLGLPKILYLILAASAFMGSCRAIRALQGREMFTAARPWLMVSLLLFGLIALSLPVAIAQGTPLSAWLRDAATYGLFAAAPVFALDAAASMRSGQLLAIAVAVAGLGALSFAINWVTIRNLAILPFDQLVLPTASLPIALFLVSLAAGIVDRPRRLTWIVLGGVALGFFLVTGARSALFFLVAMPVMVVFAGRPLIRRAIAACLGIALVAAIVVVAIQAGFVTASREMPPPIDVGPPVGSPVESPVGLSGASSPIGSPGGSGTPAEPPSTPRPAANPDNTLIQRVQAFLTSPQRDGSLRERLAQYQVAWDLFLSSPLVGVGLGHPIVWTRLDGSIADDFTADTPLVLPAKLGILGVVWLVLLAYVWLQFVRRLRRRSGITIAGLAMAGWAAILVALAWTGLSVEDKGFSFALMLLLAMGFIEVEQGGFGQPAPLRKRSLNDSPTP
jgi:hypothetical protein